MDAEKLIYDLSLTCAMAAINDIKSKDRTEAEETALKAFRAAYLDYSTRLKPFVAGVVSELQSL